MTNTNISTNINLQHGDIALNISTLGFETSKVNALIMDSVAVFLQAIKNNENAPDDSPKMPVPVKDIVVTEVEEATEEATDVKDADVSKVVDIKRKVIEGNKALSMIEKLSKFDSRTYKIMNGTPRFQLFFICEDCHYKGKLYVEQKPTFCCNKCGYRMNVKPASTETFPSTDVFGNFYVAGKFLRKEEAEKVYQFKLEQEMDEAREEDKPAKLKVK